MAKKVQSRVKEDYLEAMFLIEKEKGFVRTKDLASKMNVSSSSITDMMKKLAEDNLVDYERYGYAKLTESGKKIATSINARHKIFKEFLKLILVSDKIAEEDACEMEHNLNVETVTQFEKFVKFVMTAPSSPKWLQHFETFCKTGKHPDCSKAKSKKKKEKI